MSEDRVEEAIGTLQGKLTAVCAYLAGQGVEDLAADTVAALEELRNAWDTDTSMDLLSGQALEEASALASELLMAAAMQPGLGTQPLAAALNDCAAKNAAVLKYVLKELTVGIAAVAFAAKLVDGYELEHVASAVIETRSAER